MLTNAFVPNNTNAAVKLQGHLWQTKICSAFAQWKTMYGLQLLCILSSSSWYSEDMKTNITHTAWKVSKYSISVVSGPHFPVFGLNTGK